MFDTQLIIFWKCWLCYKGSLGYFPTSEAEKIDFCFIWLNWIQTFKLTFPFKNFLKSLKATELFRKTYFQIKVNKSGRCHNLAPGRIPWGNFRGNRSCWGSMIFPYFVYIGFRRRGNLAWRELFANLYELKSCIWIWEECNHFGRIYRVYRFDRFSSNFAKPF